MRTAPIAMMLGLAALSSLACNLIIGLSGEPALSDAAFGDGQGGDGGSCGGKDCLGGACVNGVCQPALVEGNQGGPIFIAQYGSQIYWTDAIGNTVGAADKLDGSTSIFAGNANNPFGIGADDSGVYIANSDTVWQCPLAGCPSPVTVFDAGSGNTDLALGGGLALWLDTGNQVIHSMPEPKGPIGLAAPTSSGISNVDDLKRLTTDGANVYWSETFDDVIMKAPIGKTPSTTLFTVSSGSDPSAVHYDSGVLYFATLGASNGTGTIVAGALDGSGTMTTLAASQHYPYTIATDATYVYWTAEGDAPNYTGGAIFRCAKSGCGGNPDQLASNLTDARGIAVDDVALYFVTYETGNGDGKVWRLAK